MTARGGLVYYEHIDKKGEATMAKTDNQSDAVLMTLKASRFLVYLIYAYTIVAVVFLVIGSVLLLFGANPSVGFTEFIYRGASSFLEPFRGIFPPRQVSETGYFSTSAFFAIIMYSFGAIVLSSLITYITAKMVKHQRELEGKK